MFILLPLISRVFARFKKNKSHEIIFLIFFTETRFEQLEELITRFISTPEAVKMLESTPQAVVRASVDANQTDTLLRFLNHPLQFGLIAEDYTHIYLLNHFLKAENYRDAAKVGILLMLQEDYIPIGMNVPNALNR